MKSRNINKTAHLSGIYFCWQESFQKLRCISKRLEKQMSFIKYSLNETSVRPTRKKNGNRCMLKLSHVLKTMDCNTRSILSLNIHLWVSNENWFGGGAKWLLLLCKAELTSDLFYLSQEVYENQQNYSLLVKAEILKERYLIFRTLPFNWED